MTFVRGISQRARGIAAEVGNILSLNDVQVQLQSSRNQAVSIALPTSVSHLPFLFPLTLPPIRLIVPRDGRNLQLPTRMSPSPFPLRRASLHIPSNLHRLQLTIPPGCLCPLP